MKVYCRDCTHEYFFKGLFSKYVCQCTDNIIKKHVKKRWDWLYIHTKIKYKYSPRKLNYDNDCLFFSHKRPGRNK